MSSNRGNCISDSVSKCTSDVKRNFCNNERQAVSFIRKKQKHMCQLRNLMAPLGIRGVNKIRHWNDEFEKMIPNLKMGYYHQKEYLERPCGIQMSEKLTKKPVKESVDGFEYSNLFTSKTYSILSYIVGGFVGSKSQMNNNKHNLSYDLSAAIFNLLNPCKHEREKGSWRKNTENNFYGAAPKITAEGYDKYIVKSSHKGKKSMDLELEWLAALPFLEENFLGFNDHFSSPQMGRDSLDCIQTKHSSDAKSTMENSKLENCSQSNSVDVTDRVSVCGGETSPTECSSHSVNYLAAQRFRQQSECSVESTDSESFIFFDSPDPEEGQKNDTCLNLEIYEFDSEDGNDEGDDDSICEYDICSVDKELAEANDKWWRNYEDVETQQNEGERKVRFNDDVKVNKMVAWDYAYRAARPGPWEQMARDRVRFRERILRSSPVISPVLRKEHRDKIFKELYS